MLYSHCEEFIDTSQVLSGNLLFMENDYFELKTYLFINLTTPEIAFIFKRLIKQLNLVLIFNEIFYEYNPKEKKFFKLKSQ